MNTRYLIMNTKWLFGSLPAATAILLSSHTFADNHQSLEKRVAALESSLLQSGQMWSDSLTFSGLIEVDASYVDPDSGDSTSDLVVSTVDLGVNASLTENLSVAMLFEYGDNSNFQVDIATLAYTYDNSGLSFSLGQDYVPFGGYSTVLISDPLTLAIGETRETALIVNYEVGQFSSAFYVFNGDQDEDGRDQLNNFGARIAFANDNFTLGVDYISNLADSDSLQDGDYGYSAGADVVAGASVYTEITISSVKLVLEHLRALDELAVDGDDSEPQATQFELSFAVNNFTYGIAYQETDEAQFLGLPEERISIGFNTEIAAGLDLRVELLRDDDYSVADGGTGDTTNQLVVRLAAGF